MKKEGKTMTTEYEVKLRITVKDDGYSSLEDFTECEIEAFNQANDGVTVDVKEIKSN